MLHNDAVDLSEFGELTIVRASHVEYSDGVGISGEGGSALGIKPGWYVQSAVTLDILKEGCKTREEALAWEKKHYSPTGKGWAELTQEVSLS